MSQTKYNFRPRNPTINDADPPNESVEIEDHQEQENVAAVFDEIPSEVLTSDSRSSNDESSSDEKIETESSFIVEETTPSTETNFEDLLGDESDSLFVVDDEDSTDDDIEKDPFKKWENGLDKDIIEDNAPLIDELRDQLPTFKKVLESKLPEQEKIEKLWEVAVFKDNRKCFDLEYVKEMQEFNRDLEWFNSLDNKQVEKYDAMEQKLMVNSDHLKKSIKHRIMDLPVDEKQRQVLYKHYALTKSSKRTSDFSKEQQWLETALNLPWGKMHDMKIPREPANRNNYFSSILERWSQKVEGMTAPKEEFVLLLSDLIANPNINPKILTLKGSPGTGKTLFVQSIGEILGLPVEWIDMAGLNDANFLKGFAKTWEGSEPGRLIKALTNMRSMNGIIVLEEIDKIESTQHGKEVLHSLIPILDRTRNDQFYDNYLSDLHVSLRNIIFIITINDDQAFPKPLLDRLNVMEVEKPTVERKIRIAQHYMIPKALKERNLPENAVVFTDEVIRHIISRHTKTDGNVEDGVRMLKERLQSIVQRINFYIQTTPHTVEGDEKIMSFTIENVEFPITVTTKIVDDCLESMKKKQNSLLHSMYM